ncbi:DNA polymerase, partial [Escherichia coli]|nr:DNA polymerase [Escherichia coli]
VQKRLGQLADGNQAWLNTVHPDGFIRGSVNPNGAVTGRATHSFPNVAQVPSCSAEYGAECRELFTVPDGWYLLGSDASGLELRCLANFMAR